jgi:uncharacterized membrane protein
MLMDYVTVKWLHIMSSTFLFGTGVGSAFYMLFVSLTRNTHATAVVARHVVLADWLFTTPTVFIQPLTGLYLVHLAGFPMNAKWVHWSLILYAVAVACWLPVVWLQIRMRKLAEEASRRDNDLPAKYWTLLRFWILLGIPAFFAFVGIFYLMVAKPS